MSEYHAITSFDGEFAFLSNFWPCTILYNGILYQSAEAAYQAAKCKMDKDRVPFSSMSPSKAKRVGRTVDLRDDWDEIKLQVMYDILRYKFHIHTYLKDMLLKTGDAYLQEGNYWHDTFWGVDSHTGEGENHLGKILMRIRSELRADKN